VEETHEDGVLVVGSEAKIEDTVVRSTMPNAQGRYGRGIDIEDDSTTKAPATVTVRACLVEQSHEYGVYGLGADATIIEATVVRATLPDAKGGGFGINIQNNVGATVRGCIVEQNQGTGVSILGSDATIETSVVRATLPNAQGVGFGINIQD